MTTLHYSALPNTHIPTSAHFYKPPKYCCHALTHGLFKIQQISSNIWTIIGNESNHISASMLPEILVQCAYTHCNILGSCITHIVNLHRTIPHIASPS